MERRTLLAAGAATAGGGVVAWYGGLLGGSGGSCPKPSGSLEEAMPSGDGTFQGYVQDLGSVAHVQSRVRGQDGGGINGMVMGQYQHSQSGDNFLLVLAEFGSNDLARQMNEQPFLDQYVTDKKEVGYVASGPYAWAGAGPDRETVVDLFAAADPLTADCVEESVTWG